MKPAPERALPVCTVDEPACMPADRVVAAVSAPPVGAVDLEALLRRLLPTALVQTPPPRLIPTKLEILLEHLLSETFPYMLPRWSAEKVGANYMMISPRIAAEHLRVGNGD